MIVDLHSHFFPLEVVERWKDGPVQVGDLVNSKLQFTVNGHVFVLDSALFDLDQQRTDLHRQGLDAGS